MATTWWVMVLWPDVITTGQMVLPCGQYFTLVLGLRCYQEPHPICVADGIRQHFCLGMDC